VLPRRGTPTSGKLVEMSPTEVVIEARGTRQRLAVNEIRRVSFAEEPQELRRARDNVLSGQFASALADLQKIDAASIDRPEIRQDLQFYLAFCQGRLALSAGGDKPAAKQAVLDFVVAHPDSFHFFEAAQLLGDLALALNENAVRYYATIAAKAPWPDYKLRAAVSEARALFAQRDYAGAEAKFGEVARSELNTPEAVRQKRLAEVGRASAQAELGEPDKARAELERLIAENDPKDAELFGHLYNALGRCYLKSQRPKDALLAYLHVDILFYADPELHAEALYHLSQLWSTVGQTDRATSARNLLLDRYAGSKWAKAE
jgi:tetratricopeptide (TPR) repeat protein